MKFVKPDQDEVRRRHDDNLDWKTVAPRWLLLAGLFGLAALAGALLAKVQDAASKDQQRIESAIADAPTKYQARLSERVAVIEANQADLRKSMDAQTSEVKAQSAAISEVSKQLALLTAEVRRANGTK